MVTTDYAVWVYRVGDSLTLFAAWLAIFGAVSTILWVVKTRKSGAGSSSKLLFYPFTLIWKIGITVKPSPGRRVIRRALWILVILMAASMAIFYFEIIYATYIRYFAPVKRSVAALTPLIPGVTIMWRDVPLILIAIGVGVLIHEAAHALASRLEGVRVKNAGLALFAFIPAAFVEVDENDMAKAPLSTKAKILSAGVAANLVLALLVAPLIGLFASGTLVLSVDPGSPAEDAGLKPGDIIVKINDATVKDLDELNEQLINLGFKDKNRTISFTITVIRGGSELTLNVTKPTGYTRLGVLVTNALSGPGPLLYSIWLINLALALINAAPLFVTDGGQLVREVLAKLAGNTGIALSMGIQASTLILVLSLIGINKIIIPH